MVEVVVMIIIVVGLTFMVSLRPADWWNRRTAAPGMTLAARFVAPENSIFARTVPVVANRGV